MRQILIKFSYEKKMLKNFAEPFSAEIKTCAGGKRLPGCDKRARGIVKTHSKNAIFSVDFARYSYYKTTSKSSSH